MRRIAWWIAAVVLALQVLGLLAYGFFPDQVRPLWRTPQRWLWTALRALDLDPCPSCPLPGE